MSNFFWKKGKKTNCFMHKSHSQKRVAREYFFCFFIWILVFFLSALFGPRRSRSSSSICLPISTGLPKAKKGIKKFRSKRGKRNLGKTRI